MNNVFISSIVQRINNTKHKEEEWTPLKLSF
jgi:hypothetical protein